MASSGGVRRASRWLEAWDAQGWHRTGNPGDHLAADWLVSEARAMGAEASLLQYKLDRLEPVVGRLEVDGEVIEGLPLFDAPLKADIRGQLGPAGSAAAIGIARFEPEGSSAAPMRELRMQTSHAGLVIITSGLHPGLSPVNADHFGRPYGPPALQVSSAHADLLEAAALRGASALLAIKVKPIVATSFVVVVKIPSRGPARGAPIVILTPKSSWWQSTSERGGGIVCWLECLRVLIASSPSRDVLLVATSGHELGHLGLRHFLAANPTLAADALWLHLGANIGAPGGSMKVLSPSDELLELFSKGLGSSRSNTTGFEPRSEIREVHRAGGKYVSLVGTSDWFHHEDDRWPDTINLERVASIAEATAVAVRELAEVQ